MDGFLAAGEDDGLGAALDEVAEGRRRVGQGVRPVAEDEAIVVVIPRLHRPGNVQPAVWGHVGGVDVAHLKGVHLTELLHRRDVPEKICPFHPRGQPGLCHLRGDGPPGSNHQNLFHAFPPVLSKKGPSAKADGLPLGFFSKRCQSRFERDQPTLFHFSITARSWLVIFLRSLLGLPLLAWMMATRSMAARSNSW